MKDEQESPDPDMLLLSSLRLVLLGNLYNFLSLTCAQIFFFSSIKCAL